MLRNTLTLLALFLLIPSWVQATCRLQTSFDDCLNKNQLTLMICESKNTDRLYEYYSCLCEAKRSIYNCYTMCTNDADKQLESQNLLLEVVTTCQQAENHQLQFPSTTTSSSSSDAVMNTNDVARTNPSPMTTWSPRETTTLSSPTPSSTRNTPSVTLLSSNGHRILSNFSICCFCLVWMALAIMVNVTT
jgi:hypothetical protein